MLAQEPRHLQKKWGGHGICCLQAQLGRDFGGQRWGPRPIDLDIIFYEGDAVVVSEETSPVLTASYYPNGVRLEACRAFLIASRLCIHSFLVILFIPTA